MCVPDWVILLYQPELFCVGGQLLFHHEEDLDKFCDDDRPEWSDTPWWESEQQHTEAHQYLCYQWRNNLP